MADIEHRNKVIVARNIAREACWVGSQTDGILPEDIHSIEHRRAGEVGCGF
jgi:hypothetical protein